MKVSTLRHFVLCFALLGLMSCSSDSESDDQLVIDIGNPPATKQIEIEILELLNDYRITNGLNSLDVNDTVKAVAFTHTDYMIEVDNVSHDNFFMRQQAIQENENAQRVAENVAYGYSSAQSVVNAWLNSPGHKGTIEGDYSHFDISAEKGINGRWYFTNIFIKR